MLHAAARPPRERSHDHHPLLHCHSEDCGWCVPKGLAWRTCCCMQHHPFYHWCSEGSGSVHPRFEGMML